jgi:fibronectin type 3 domain-containing protein
MRWNSFAIRQLRRPARRQTPVRGKRPTLEELESRFAPSGTNVLTYHNDTASTGLNPNESQLTTSNVVVNTFDKQFTTSVDGQVYAQPLVDTGITIASGPNTTSGSPGVHDVVFVATEHDSLYAIDDITGSVLWQRSFTNISSGYIGTTPGTNINNIDGASAITTVTSSDVGTTDISPEIGITSTPVIDSTTNILYVLVKTKETINSTTTFTQQLHAINLADGTDAASPYVVGMTTGSNTNTTNIFVYGTGDGHVTDPYYGTGKQVVQFNALRESNRSGLNLVNNAVYVAWASHGDNGPYHGWVVKWDVSNITTTGFNLTGVLCTSPNDGLSGIWEGGGRLVFESDGSAFYFETGNGSGGAPTLNAQGFPTNANYNEALVKAVADSSSTAKNQNPNGWGLMVADYFIPYNVVALDNADSDFGSGAPTLLPDSAGIPGHPHLIVAGGKEGKIYVIDRDNLGHFDPNKDHVLNDGTGNTPPVSVSGLLSTGAFYNGNLYFVSGYNGSAYEYTINSSGTLVADSQTAIGNFGYVPGSPSISSSGTTNGVVWQVDTNLNELHAYDANTLNTELWNSSQAAGDSVGTVVKFAVPTEANGEVFVGTTNSLVAYGLNQPPTAVPNAPVLSATALTGATIELTWSDSSVKPNTASGYLIEESPDGNTFTQIATAPQGATSIGIGGLTPLTQYWFRIRGFNSIGDSDYSDVATATTTSSIPTLDYSAGFAGSTSTLTYNGSATINISNDAELTDGNGGEASSVFSTNTVGVTQFTSIYTFQLLPGSSPIADGLTFTIQNVGPTALGSAGGNLGYTGISSSVAIKFDLYSNQGEGTDSTGLFTDGAVPGATGSIDLTGTGIDLHSGDQFTILMNYDGTTLKVTETDDSTSASASQSYTIDIPGTIGSKQGYVGFTAGTGGLTAIQNILNWTYYATASTTPNAPSGLGATPASASSVSLTWTNNATNQTGFHLDRATDSKFTQNLITENLPSSPYTYTDTASGLSPGNTYYYRLRAYNAAGDSGNSNSASVAIPLPPPVATNQQITNVTTKEIDMSWQDNAGHQAQGYQILRAVNHGTFTQVASLPPTSRTPPSTYLWSDTGLIPGDFYDYEIIAYNVSGNNGFAEVSATTITHAPTGMVAVPIDGGVRVHWTATPGAVSYNVYRSTVAGGEGTSPYATGVKATSFRDPSLPNNTTFYYEVTAVNGNSAPLPSESAFSHEVSSQSAPIHLSLTAAGPVTAGQPFSITVRTLDQNNKLVWGYIFTAHFTSTDAGTGVVLPADYTFTAGDKGVKTFTGVTLVTYGSRTITVTDTVDSSITANASPWVQPGAATHFALAISGTVTAGAPFTVTVTAFDAYGNKANGYRGTVHFTSTDPNAVLPGNYTFTATDSGKHVFTNAFTLTKVGTQTITATDTVTGSITGSISKWVKPGAATQLLITGPSSVTAGVAFSITVTAEDKYGNKATGYLGTIHFSSGDVAAVLPADYPFKSTDGGTHSFSGVILKSKGQQKITATDILFSTIFGSETVQVN